MRAKEIFPLSNKELQQECQVLLPKIAQICKQKQLMLSCAESCTGGLVSAICTTLAGSSAWFDCSFVTYSNNAKAHQLDVPSALIQEYGAVSEEVVRSMAVGAIKHSQSQCALAITGIAGPKGASENKPVGTVWFAWSVDASVYTQKRNFAGNRTQVRELAAVFALQHLCSVLLA